MINAFYSFPTTIQFASPPLRESGDTPELFQVDGFDSLGRQCIYDKSDVYRTARKLIYPRETAATCAALQAFASTTIRGARWPFTWYDHEGTTHTVRLSGEIAYRQTGPNRYRIEIPIEEDQSHPISRSGVGLDALTGASPVCFFKIIVNGISYYFSDRNFSFQVWGVGDIMVQALVTSWGRVQEGIANALDEFRIADFTATLAAGPACSTDLIALAEAYPLETSPVELYLWSITQDEYVTAPVMKFRGYVRDVEIPDDVSISLTIEDESSRLNNYIGTKVDRVAYPSADPDDVGKMIPIPYGTVTRLPALALDSGAQTSLPAAITATALSFNLSDASYLSAGAVVQVDDEQLLIGTVTGNTVTATRGYNGTLAAVHQKGAAVWECKTEFVYVVSATPLDAINKIIGVIGEIEVDITAVSTRYTGQTGNSHADYPGMAIVTLPGLITVTQAVDLLVDSGLSVTDATSIVDGISIDDQIAISDTITISDTTSVSDTIGVDDPVTIDQGMHGHSGTNYTDTLYLDDLTVDSGAWAVAAANAIDDNLTTSGLTTTATNITRFFRRTAFSRAETPAGIRIGVKGGDGAVASAGFTLFLNGSNVAYASIMGNVVGEVAYSSWTTLPSWSSISAANTYIMMEKYNSGQARVYEVWLEVQSTNSLGQAPALGVAKVGIVSKTGTATKVGTVNRSGSVAKSGFVSKIGTVTKSGAVSLAGTVSLSGNSVANTMVGDSILCDIYRNCSTPAEVEADILSRSGNPSLQQVGTFPVNYRLNGAITEYRTAREWLDIIAFQCRAWFRMDLGTAKLIVRPDSLVPTYTIAACRIDSDGRRIHSRKKVDLADVLNRIQVLFDRDWSKSAGDNAYRGATTTTTDATSIANFGERERPDLFRFDFVTDQAMAESVRDVYLASQSGRPWLHSFETYLDHHGVKFGDVVTLGFANNAVGIVLEAGLAPGSVSQIDTMKFTVLVP